MAFTVTGRGSTEFTYSGGGNVGDTFTPAEDDILVIGIVHGGTPTFTVSGFSATWSSVADVGTNTKLKVYAARIGASPSSGQVSVTTGSSTFSVIVMQIAGASTTGAVTDAFVQSQTVSSYNPSSPLAIPTLSAFASATNLSLSFGGIQNAETFTAQSGWTEAVQTGAPSNGVECSAFYKASEDTTHTVEGGAFAYNWVVGAGFEIAEAGAAGPSLDDVGGNDTVVVGDTEAITYSNFTTAIETATINDGGTATTNLTVSSAGATSANIQLASLSAWVNTKACPFTSTNQTSQQVTVTSTDEDPDETASRAVTFNPPSGYTVIETNGMTWPAPDGSILKGFASQPPANSQVIHPNGLTVTASGIVSTDLTTNQACYFYNETTEEGSSFQFLIESEGTKAGISTGLTNGIKEAITRGGLI